MTLYTPKFKPYAHQAEALRALKGRKAFALLMEMRTGKSMTTLTDWGQLELDGEVDRLAVIAPGGVYKTWETACKDHLADDLSKRLTLFTWKSGAGAGYKRELAHFLSPACEGPKIFLINIEALSSVKAAREALIAFLEGGTVMTVIDEVTCIKNPTASRSEFVIKEVAPRSDYRRVLSGLIAPRSPLDVYVPFEFLDKSILGFRSFFGFRARFAVMRPMVVGGRAIQAVVDYRDLDELQARIAPHSFRVRLEDCYDLPPKIYMRRDVTLTPEQEKAYKEMRAYATTQLASGEHVTATVVIAQIIRLHQILCGHTVDENGTEHEIPENRTATLLEALEEYDGKAIVWCSYDKDIHKVTAALRKVYGEGAVARFWGGNRSVREEEERQFLTLPECRFMVATPAAGGRGRTWTNASLTIYYSSTPDLEHRSQSEERTQGVGKTQSSAYIDLMVPGTVEEKFIALLRKKINLSSVINGDNYREWLI